MPCYSPIQAFIAPGKTENGKKVIVFKKPAVYMDKIDLPCGQCIGCKLIRSIHWATRIMHEASQYEKNCFITLTYDDKNLPEDYSLDKQHFQKFIKRLRHAIKPKKLRYFMCGEYGDDSWRPHYHAIIFNYDFPDKLRVQSKEVGNPYYISKQLSALWQYGFHIIADVTFESAAYVARYCTKKITGEKADIHYSRTILDWNEFTGEIYRFFETQLEPEYATMSRRPGIGKDWFKKFYKDCYPSDYLIQDGRKIPIPKYYDKLLELEDEYIYKAQKFSRQLALAKYSEELTLARLRIREDVKHKQLESLRRNKI